MVSEVVTNLGEVLIPFVTSQRIERQARDTHHCWTTLIKSTLSNMGPLNTQEMLLSSKFGTFMKNS